MRIVALVLAIATLSPWLGLPTESANALASVPLQTSARGPVTADIDDSDQFFQNTIHAAGPQRDYSQKIEALLKRMTLEEKVGQMTQLTINMIVNGQDQNIQIDPAKLDKAIARYGVGSILNVDDQALTPEKWQDTISDPDRGKENASRNSGALRYRLNSRRELCAGFDSVSPGDRHGRNLESRVDETSYRDRRDGNSRRRHPLEFFTRA